MAKRYNMPWYFPMLRDALRPVHDKLDEIRLTTDSGPSNTKGSNTASLIMDHLDRISADIDRLVDEVMIFGWALADAASDSDAREADSSQGMARMEVRRKREAEILRAVAGLEARVDRMLRNQDEAERLEVSGEEDSDAVTMLHMVYDSALWQIRDTLRDWLDFLDDPQPASGKSQPGVRKSGNIVQFELELDTPLMLDDLLEWLKRRAMAGHAPYDQTMAFVDNYSYASFETRSVGPEVPHDLELQDDGGCGCILALMGIFLGLMALGWLFGNW